MIAIGGHERHTNDYSTLNSYAGSIIDITLPNDFKDFLRLLNEHQVEYLLIGGYAVGYHGYPRATNDMDSWIMIHPENATTNKEKTPMLINDVVGRRIRKQREKLGLKQHDIAHALQVSPQAVSKWERGENAPDISLLVPLAKLLGVSTDSLLGYHNESPDVFEATVFFSVVGDYAKKAQTMPAKAVATWANGFFYQLTEAILHDDGIPVKYMGDTFLCFFSGPNHQRRAVQAAFHARSIVTENLRGAINSGDIYLGTVGHPDYARPDIMGDTVNIAFMTMKWTVQHATSDITATASVVEHLGQSMEIGPQHTVEFPDTKNPVTVYEIVGDSLNYRG